MRFLIFNNIESFLKNRKMKLSLILFVIKMAYSSGFLLNDDDSIDGKINKKRYFFLFCKFFFNISTTVKALRGYVGWKDFFEGSLLLVPS